MKNNKQVKNQPITKYPFPIAPFCHPEGVDERRKPTSTTRELSPLKQQNIPPARSLPFYCHSDRRDESFSLAAPEYNIISISSLCHSTFSFCHPEGVDASGIYDEGSFSLGALESNPATPEKDSSLTAFPRNDTFFERGATLEIGYSVLDIGYSLRSLGMTWVLDWVL